MNWTVLNGPPTAPGPGGQNNLYWEIPKKIGTTTLVLQWYPTAMALSGIPLLFLFRNGVQCTLFDPTQPGQHLSSSASQRGFSISGPVITMGQAFDANDEFDVYYIPTTQSAAAGSPIDILTQPQGGTEGI